MTCCQADCSHPFEIHTPTDQTGPLRWLPSRIFRVASESDIPTAPTERLLFDNVRAHAVDAPSGVRRRIWGNAGPLSFGLPKLSLPGAHSGLGLDSDQTRTGPNLAPAKLRGERVVVRTPPPLPSPPQARKPACPPQSVCPPRKAGSLRRAGPGRAGPGLDKPDRRLKEVAGAGRGVGSGEGGGPRASRERPSAGPGRPGRAGPGRNTRAADEGGGWAGPRVSRDAWAAGPRARAVRGRGRTPRGPRRGRAARRCRAR